MKHELRRWFGQARDAIFYSFPPELRHRVAGVLPDRLTPPLTRSDSLLHFYDAGDPFGFDSNPIERLKYEQTLDLCGEGDLGRVLEIGCATGAFTEMLAPRSSYVLATDIAPSAIDQARERLRNQSHLEFEVRALPSRFPESSFDLIVVSDVLYYLSVADLLESIEALETSLAPGGALVAVHYSKRTGGMLDGNEAHDILSRNTTLEQVFSGTAEFGEGRKYRLDRYEKPR